MQFSAVLDMLIVMVAEQTLVFALPDRKLRRQVSWRQGTNQWQYDYT